VPVIRISNFEGTIPKTSPKLLAENQAQIAENCELERGMIQPLRDLEFEFNVGGQDVIDSGSDKVTASGDQVIIAGAKTIYKLVDKWLNWKGEDVDVVKSFIPDVTPRIYFTGDGVPKQTNYDMATEGPSYTWPTTSYRLGVPAPIVPLKVVREGEGNGIVQESISYVWTYVTGWGEESAPSPPSDVVDLQEDEYIHLSGFANPPADMVNATHIRVYRLNTGTSLAEYQLVPYPPDNIPEYEANTAYSLDDRVTYGSKTYKCIQAFTPPPEHAPNEGDYWEEDLDDCLIEDAIANGFDDKREDDELLEAIATEDWEPPPEELAGLHLFVNNILAGFKGSEVYLSVPGYPYAWPDGYALQARHDIVGVGHFGETLVAVTDGVPYYATGTDPSSMTLMDLPYERPCVGGAKSVVSTEGGVIYPSDDGLFMVSREGGTLLTRELFTKEQWQAKSLANLMSAFYDDKYFAFFSGASTGFILNMQKMRIIDFSISGKTFYDVITVGDYLYVLIEDPDTGSYDVYTWEEAATELTYTWKSKVFHLFSPFNFNAGRIVADDEVDFRLYVDGVLKWSKNIQSDEIFRMPGGYTGKDIELEVVGTSDIDLMAIATSIDELIQAAEE
jgi:hypothetical protein